MWGENFQGEVMTIEALQSVEDLWREQKMARQLLEEGVGVDAVSQLAGFSPAVVRQLGASGRILERRREPQLSPAKPS